MSLYTCDCCGTPTDNDQSVDIRDSRNNEKVYHIEAHRCDVCDKRISREVAWESKGETWREDELVCPFCNTSYEDYEAYGFDEGTTHEVECLFCGRKFELEVETRRLYSTKRSLCEMPEDFDEEEAEA